jgi:hypothetical protein
MTNACRSRPPYIEELEARCTPSCSLAIYGSELRATCDNAYNRVTLSHSGSTTVLNGRGFADTSFSTVYIYTGNGGHDVDLNGTVKPVAVDTQSGNGTINLTCDGIQSTVTVLSGGAFNVINMNLGAAQTCTISGGFVAWDGVYRLLQLNVSELDISGPLSNKTFNILGTAPGTETWLFGSGSDTFNVSPGQLRSYLYIDIHRLDSPPPTGGDLLNVDDSATTTDQYYSIDVFTVYRSGVPSIFFGGTRLVLTCGRGSNTVNVYDTYPDTTIYPGSGPLKTVNVRGTTGSLVIDGGGSPTYDVINVGNAGSVQGIRGVVTVYGWPNDTQLNVDDSADSTGRTATIGAGAITGLAPAAINYQTDALNILTVYGGPGANIFTVADTPSNPYWDVVTTLHPGSGALKTVNARGTTGPLAIDDRGSPTYDVINVGNAGSVQNIQGPVTIYGWPNDTQLNVDDSADLTGRSMTISAGAITGLAPAAINYQTDALNILTVYGGPGANIFTVTGTPSNPYWDVVTTLYPGYGVLKTVNVRGTTAPLVIDGRSNPTYDLINVGNAGSVQGIRGAVTVYGWPNDTQLNVDDSADSPGRTATIGAGAITGLAPAAINYQTDALNILTVYGGPGANIFTVADTPSNPYWDVVTTLYSGSGPSKTVNVRRTTGPLNISGGSGSNTLTGPDAATTWSLTGFNRGALAGPTFAGSVTFSAFQNLIGGAGDDTFVFSDGAGVSGFIDGAGGTNTLDYSAYTSAVVVDLDHHTATGVGQGVFNIQNVIYPSGGGGSGGGSPPTGEPSRDWFYGDLARDSYDWLVRSPAADQLADQAEPVRPAESPALKSRHISGSASVIPPSASERRRAEAFLFGSGLSERRLPGPVGRLSAAELDLLTENLINRP